MLIFRGKKHGLSHAQMWFPDSPGSIKDEMRRTATIQVFHADFPAEDPELLKARATWRDFWTTVIPLQKSAEELRKQMDPKSCRYEIRKSDKIPFTTYVNERDAEARQLISEFISRSGYRRPMGDPEWEQYKTHTDIHSIYHEDTIVAAHLLILDPPNRVRLTISATQPRDDERYRHIVGPLNRRLHWEEFMYYKDRGFSEYDFGGVTLDATNSYHSISQFKLSFGGELKKQNDFFLIKNDLIRPAWKLARSTKATLTSAKKWWRKH